MHITKMIEARAVRIAAGDSALRCPVARDVANGKTDSIGRCINYASKNGGPCGACALVLRHQKKRLPTEEAASYVVSELMKRIAETSPKALYKITV